MKNQERATDYMKYNIKMWMTRVVLLALIIFWMNTIFGFSAETGEDSQSLSDKITIKVVQIIKPDYDSLNTEEQEKFFDKASFFVRKTGHFGEYAILGLLFGAFLITFEEIRSFRKSKTLVIIISTVFCMLYAATDEFHQGFVDGRSPQFRDVCIDIIGGLTGVVFLILIWFIIGRNRRVDTAKAK